MPLLNFLKRFSDDVESGKKRQTIRARRKDGKDPKKGDRLYLYTGLRTVASRKIGESDCNYSVPIQIDNENVVVGGDLLCDDDIDSLAHHDGFDNSLDFREFFVKHPKAEGGDHPQFDGFLIKWGDIESA